jgi:hypothetical protein
VPIYYMLTAALFILVSVWLLWGLMAAGRTKRMLTEQVSGVRSLILQLKPFSGMENNLNLLLEMMGRAVDAPLYAFYMLDEHKQNYSLKAVRHQKPKVGKAAPSYSGLTPYSGQTYLPPTALPLDRRTSEPIAWIVEEGVPLLQISIEGGFGIVLTGPIRKQPRRIAKRIAQTAEMLPPVVEWLLQAERLMEKAKAAQLSEEAWRQLGLIASDPEAVVSKAFGIAAASLELEDSGGVWEAGEPEGRQPVTIVAEENPGKLLYVCRYRTPQGFVTRNFRASRERNTRSVRHVTASLRTACREAEAFHRAASQANGNVEGKINALKRLSRTMDNMNPWTVGYSEQMSRYATIIARELGFSGEQIQDMALAAYLSHIGASALSKDLLTKDGRYTEDEYGRMKLHAEFGALLVEMTLGNKQAAEAIRYHHERMDGRGYPERLQGESIPAGARIIAVAQAFLAAINGRPSRDPLSFGDALGRLQAASGTALDPVPVAALTAWFRRKRMDAGPGLKPLGACWEMCCAPSALCETCPSYGQTEKPCWTFESNNCTSHGKACKTCFVYTEAEGRSMRREVLG